MLSHPTKGDWSLQVMQDIEDFHLSQDLTFFENITVTKFKELIRSRAKKYAFEKYIMQKKTHKKMDNLSYNDLSTQQYFVREDISIESKKMIFRWRVNMERFGENFRGGRDIVLCPLCGQHRDNESLSFSCAFVKQKMQIRGNFEDLYKPHINNDVINTIHEISQLRKKHVKT